MFLKNKCRACFGTSGDGERNFSGHCWFSLPLLDFLIFVVELCGQGNRKDCPYGTNAVSL
jgi:hypothetical protein